MNEHATIRELLALAAAGVLQIDEQRRVDDHLRDCIGCQAELEHWRSYAQGLQRLHQPAVPANLMERTRARILQERAAIAGVRTEGLLLSTLAAFAWIVGLTFWFLLRVFSGGPLMLLGTDLTGLLTWSLASTVFVWLTAAAAALLLGRRRELRSIL
jgi:predicted anti-sigma-YlaC factor YlaD